MTTPDGQALKRSAEVEPSANVTIRFADASRAARMDEDAATASETPVKNPAKKPAEKSVKETGKKPDKRTGGPSDNGQDSLF